MPAQKTVKMAYTLVGKWSDAQCGRKDLKKENNFSYQIWG